MSKKKRFISLLALLLALVSFFNLAGAPSVVPASAVTTSSDVLEELKELENRSEEIEAEIEELQGQLAGNLSELKDLVAKKDLVDQEIVMLYEQIDVVNAQIDACSRLIALLRSAATIRRRATPSRRSAPRPALAAKPA